VNFREDLPELLPEEPKQSFLSHVVNIVKELKSWLDHELFWRRAKNRHKAHASKWAIFKEDHYYYPAMWNFLNGWEYIGCDLYCWNAEHKSHTACKTRYKALRRIAEKRKAKYNLYQRT